MKILIAGIPEHTANYERALSLCHAAFETDLHPADLSSFGGLLLPGGGDIHPSWFGQEDQGSLSVDRELDRAQFALLGAFLSAGRPVLGICRGMQLINVFFGGSLIQHLPSANIHRWDGQDQIHPADCLPGPLLSLLYGSTCLINSAHHQGVRTAAPGREEPVPKFFPAIIMSPSFTCNDQPGRLSDMHSLHCSSGEARNAL